jgi:hypothetical protein
VESGEVAIPGLVGIVVPPVWPGPGAKAQLSVDGGEAWLPVAQVANGGLAGKPLRFRFELAAGQGIRGLRLKARVEPDRLIELKDEETRLLLDRETGGLLLVENLLTGEAVVNPGRPRPPFGADLRKPGEAVWARFCSSCVGFCSSVPARWVAGNSSLVQAYVDRSHSQ